MIPLALVAFAANSILCRLALRDTTIDAATFTLVRVAAGAAALFALVRLRGAKSASGAAGDPRPTTGSWRAAAALFAYAILFSLAYRELSAGTGALLLFGAVQVTMILWGWRRGERPRALQLFGVGLASSGLAWLVLPRADLTPLGADLTPLGADLTPLGGGAPPPLAALAMLAAGAAWGSYTLLGRGAADPLATTAGNFARATPLAVLAASVALVAPVAPLAPLAMDTARWDARGALLAALSGALTSGVGYAIWYAALRGVRATVAASVQLAVPLLAALAGVLWLGESWSLRATLSAAAILGGIALVLRAERPAEGPPTARRE